MPPTPKAAEKSEAAQEAEASVAAAEELMATSSDATKSTYAPADVPETNPPSGPGVVQTRGKP
jgi:hypothetical protein